jgi:pimeloyl-ACP methyl ester carboxylesterase
MKSYQLNLVQACIRYHNLPGEGVPILFIHGLGCASSCDYPRVAGDKFLSGRHIFLIDLLGYGFSDKPENFSYTVGEHARTICELADALSLNSYDLYGHSMGGTIAIVVASLRPDSVRKIAVSEPNLDPGGGPFSRLIAGNREVYYVKRGHQKVIRKARTEGNDIWAASMSSSFPPAVYRDAVSLVQGSDPTWREILENLKIPKTVIFGEKSLPDPDTVNLPKAGVKIEIVAEAGHSLAWENPFGLAKAISEALKP